MNQQDLKAAARGQGALASEIATRASDPLFYSALDVLPNPDTVLRKLGKSQEVFDAIHGDAHVLGELRSIRAALLGYEWRLQAGGDAPADIQAHELCQALMARRPAPGMQWADVIWSMAMSVFKGFAVHEVIWERQDNYLMPALLADRPQRRFVFGTDNRLRLITRSEMMRGVELGEFKWLLTRHMPAYENPYGVAVYSACFWPYTFKHGGWKFFIKFCERHGLPWPIGKYPPGTPKAQQEELVDALAAIVQDGCAAIPNDASVELVATGTGMAALPQERLINLCNREMSKALTSQTLATEIQDTGARAASETHRGREMAVNQCDRAIIEDSFNELLAWVTELNIAGAVPPRFEFYQESEARETWASVLDTARGYLDIPVQFAHERLQIPLPAEGEETLPRAVAPVPGVGPEPAAFAAACCPRCGGHRFAADDPPDPASIDAALATLTDEELQGQMDKIIEPVLAFIKKNGVTSETLGRLAEVYPDMDDEALQELLGRMLFVAEVWGRIEAGGGTP